MVDQNRLIETFVQAVATRESYYATKRFPTIPQRLHNPCDLVSWKDPKGRPFPMLNGFVNFPACLKDICSHPDHPSEVGFAAGRGQCRINIIKRRLTFYEFFVGKKKVYGGFCPKGDGKNDSVKYATDVLAFVVRRLGLDPEAVNINTPIYTLIDLPAAKAA